ncbi:hypothetical protein EON83_18830 [bacterium]|nr:MAG: hypothetical protein EON83_18830 [bacterium]
MTRELITPELSQTLVLLAAIVVSILGAALGFFYKKTRGLIAALCGPLLFALWLLHGALVERFGMDSLGLLLFEGLVFIALGAALGVGWSRLGARNTEI